MHSKSIPWTWPELIKFTPPAERNAMPRTYKLTYDLPPRGFRIAWVHLPGGAKMTKLELSGIGEVIPPRVVRHADEEP